MSDTTSTTDLCTLCHGPAHNIADHRHVSLAECRDRCAAERDQYKQLHRHALDCVDRVFQLCTEIPDPILPDFLPLGADKFVGVIALAKAYKALAAHRDAYREEADRLRPARECPGCGRSTEAKAWCDECVQTNQGTLAARVRELTELLETERVWLRDLQDKNATLAARVAELEASCDAWDALCVQAAKERDAAESRVAELERDNDRLTGWHLSEEHENERLRACVAEREKQLTDTVEECERLERETERLRAALEQWEDNRPWLFHAARAYDGKRGGGSSIVLHELLDATEAALAPERAEPPERRAAEGEGK